MSLEKIRDLGSYLGACLMPLNRINLFELQEQMLEVTKRHVADSWEAKEYTHKSDHGHDTAGEKSDGRALVVKTEPDIGSVAKEWATGPDRPLHAGEGSLEAEALVHDLSDPNLSGGGDDANAHGPELRQS